MYKLAVKKEFTAHHFLIGGDWGPENQKHSHNYKMEIQLQAKTLDENGFLVDIVNVEGLLEHTLSRFRDHTLNELPEFKGKNPSIENLARVAFQSFHRHFGKPGMPELTVKIWEDNKAWVSYQEE